LFRHVKKKKKETARYKRALEYVEGGVLGVLNQQDKGNSLGVGGKKGI